MATLYKRGKYWYADFRYQGKRYQRSLKTTSKEAARLLLADLELKIAKSEIGITEGRSITLLELAQKYMDYCRANGYSLSTLKCYKSRYKDFVAFFSNGYKSNYITQITSERIEQFKAYR